MEKTGEGVNGMYYQRAGRRILKNHNELIGKGSGTGRRIALDIVEHAMRDLDSYHAVEKLVRFSGHTLSVGRATYDARKLGRIYVVGAGKATLPMAAALNRILGERIAKGVVIVKEGQARDRTHLGNIDVVTASHPLPDGAGVRGAERILRIADAAEERDIVFCLITGGASALMSVPADGISLRDKRETTKLLLDLGISVEEINSVRNHISSIKGGRLALRIHPAEIVNFIVVDQVKSVLWGPTVPDPSRAEDAIAILKRYGLWRKVPASIRRHLTHVVLNPSLETPKNADFLALRLHNLVLGDNSAICRAARKRARQLGLNSVVLTSVLEGESKEAGIVLSSIATQVELKRRGLVRPPCAIIAGGETTVAIAGKRGLGGPSQELALGASLKIDGTKKIVVASIDTDGTDGPTTVAGAIVDGDTVARSKEMGIDVYSELVEHNSNFVLSKLRDTIVTGPTGTNVMDLNVIVVTD